MPESLCRSLTMQVKAHEHAQEQVAEVLRLSEEHYRFLIEGVPVVAW